MIYAMDQLLATTIMTVESSIDHCPEKGKACLLCRVQADSKLV